MSYDISVVLGSKNRKGLIKATIKSIRENGFKGNLEIIVVDGGSTDGTCDWLAKQKDVFTIIQPNYKYIDQDGISVLAHSWGEFMNIGFKYASAPYIVMVSDDLILHKGCLQNGFDEMERRRKAGDKIGAGAFYFREFPRHKYYRVGLLPGNFVALNHGFYSKEALISVDFLDEKNYNFYAADSDIVMRMNLAGWKSIALETCFSEHLCHKPKFKDRGKLSPSNQRDMDVFDRKYPYEQENYAIWRNCTEKTDVSAFYLESPLNVFYGYLLKYYDEHIAKESFCPKKVYEIGGCHTD